MLIIVFLALAAVPTPISTSDLYYTSSVCLAPDIQSCSDKKDAPLKFIKTQYQDCNHPHMKFVMEADGTLKHHCTGKYVCPDNNQLFMKSSCNTEDAKFERLGVSLWRDLFHHGITFFWRDLYTVLPSEMLLT